MNKYNTEKILSIHHWNDKLFSFTCTRNKSFKFINGEFTLVGLLINDKYITRAYSLVSSNYDIFLEFLSIKINKGLLTSNLKKISLNDNILISKKSTGTLIINNLLPNGKILWLISSGTGLAPFISIIKDYNIYNIFDKIILLHSVKYSDSLSYRYYINNILSKKFNLFNYSNKLIYYPILTRENFFNKNRITFNINNYKIFDNLNLTPFNIKRDRIMLCGSISMINDIVNILYSYNFIESKINKLGHFLIERSFVD
ncbi:Ferredoxin--NADP(+) reductase [Candidatus Nasuia deltocephalinicola]|nr:Ferredoxin--NADP(+) reductase [Candidatus Nasuia deltocephalinicola]